MYCVLKKFKYSSYDLDSDSLYLGGKDDHNF